MENYFVSQRENIFSNVEVIIIDNAADTANEVHRLTECLSS